MLTVRRATPEDAASLAPRLREADLRELLAGGFRDSPEMALLEGVHSPDGAYAAVDEQDLPHILFGTHPSHEPHLGFIWMMASDGIDQHWVQIVRETRTWVNELRGTYRVLANAVHAENTRHIRWLKWAGFILIRPFEFNGHTFFEFARITHKEGSHV